MSVSGEDSRASDARDQERSVDDEVMSDAYEEDNPGSSLNEWLSNVMYAYQSPINMSETANLGEDESNNTNNFMFDQDVSQEDLARAVILHEYPFSIVNHVKFRKFLKTLQPEFRIPGRSTLEADCMQIFREEKKKLYDILDKLPSRISLTYGMWSSGQSKRYLALTGHFIDDKWHLQKRILSFSLVEDSHSGDEISKIILTKLFDWNIDGKVCCAVLDDTSANDVAAKELIKRLAANGNLLLNGEFFHVCCCAHALNLIVQDGLEAIKDVITKVRESVKYVNASEQGQQKFLEACNQVQTSQKEVILDVPTRWNSTYMMLENALQFKDAFLRLQEQDEFYRHAPSLAEWQNAQIVCDSLKLFYDVTKVFSSTTSPTANHYFIEVCNIHLLLKKWSESDIPLRASMAMHMMEKFEKYWDNTSFVLAIASVLDPRVKMKAVKYYFPLICGFEAEDKIYGVQKRLHELYNEYHIRCPHSATTECSSSSIDGDNDLSILNLVSDPLLSELAEMKSGFYKFLEETASSKHAQSELELYLDEALHPSQWGPNERAFDVLSWWEHNGVKYPIVARMARDILAVPVFTAVSEAAFSTRGRALGLHRCSLHPSTVEGVICAQDWIKSEYRESEHASNDETSLGGMFDDIEVDDWSFGDTPSSIDDH